MATALFLIDLNSKITIQSITTNGVTISKQAGMVTISGYMSLPCLIPEGYRPANPRFVPVVASNGTGNYMTLYEDGSCMVGYSAIATGSYFIACSYIGA